MTTLRFKNSQVLLNNNDRSRAPLRPKAQEPNPEESVPRAKLWAIDGTSQNGDLVLQSKDLGLERGTTLQGGGDIALPRHSKARDQRFVSGGGSRAGTNSWLWIHKTALPNKQLDADLP